MRNINIDKYGDLELALMCLLGYFGSGVDRLRALGTRYTKVQPMVNKLVCGVVPPSTSINYEVVKNALLKMTPTKDDYVSYVDELMELIKKEVNTDG